MQGTDSAEIVALVDAALRSDRRSQYELYRRYERGMFSVCVRMLNNHADAEDVLQEAFLEAFRRLPQFRREVAFGAWLKRIVVNRSINALKKRRLELSLDDPEAPAVPDRPEEPIEEPAYEIDAVKRGIQALPDGYRVVLSLYLLEGYDHQEIAQILGITESTSKSQYLRAKRKLKAMLLAMENG